MNRLSILLFTIIASIRSSLSAPNFSHESGCGTFRNSSQSRRRGGRIVGGVECFEGEFPWMVSFKDGDSGSHFCGGFVISDHFILSAAHCFLKDGRREESSFAASIGEFSLRTPESLQRELTLPVGKVHLHPKYEESGREWDIALVELKQTARSHPMVEPICLPPKGVKVKGQGSAMSKVTTAGWGKQDWFQTWSSWSEETDRLRKVEVSLWDTEECRKSYQGFSNFPAHSPFICAGGRGSQSCFGDSGGPLMKLEGGKWVAIGIVSVGQQCGDQGRPAVYTEVADYLPWIQETLNTASL